MKSLVVFESMFGNTKAFALAIAEGLAKRLTSDAVEVGDALRTPDSKFELLVVGGPTHAFSLSRPGTRNSAAVQAKGELVSKGIGLREWLGEVRWARPSVRPLLTPVSTSPGRPGSAAKAAAKRLQRVGLWTMAPPQSFYVSKSEGPLLAGELERAHRWGEELAESLIATKEASC